MRNLATVGKRVKLKPYRQVWRLEHRGQAYYLKWFPRAGAEAKRVVRGDPAKREYERMIWLQKAGVPSPRAAAYLSGLILEGNKGDAVLSVAVEPSETLDRFIQRHRIAGLPIPGRRELCAQVIELVNKLANSGLGHSDLHLGNFLLHNGKLFLLDAYAVSKTESRILPPGDLEVLAYGVAATATRTELLRGWRALGNGNRELPKLASSVARRQWRKSLERMLGNTEYAGVVKAGDWEGLCFKRWAFPLRFSRAAGLQLTPEDWTSEWPRLLKQIEAETLNPLKRGRSADVWEAEVVLGGIPIEVVIKRAFRRYPYRYITELGRGSRSWRAWKKSWMLLVRGIPAAWPLALLERKMAGVVADQFIICEKVRGWQLDALPSQIQGAERDLLFRRVGKLLRRIELTQLVHFDTKASNFMAMEDEKQGWIPVLVDVDGVRGYTWRGEGLRRLLEDIETRPERFRDGDAAALRAGYAPWGAK